MDSPLELLDLVDENDIAFGTIERRAVPTLFDMKHGFVRGAGCLIVRDNLYWIPRRQPHKKIAPNGLDFSVGEHVEKGESYEQAILRGLREEAGVHTTLEQLSYVTTLQPFGALPYFIALYLYGFEGSDNPSYNTEDFASGSWMSAQQTMELLHQGVAANDYLLHALQYLQTQHD